MTLADIVRIPKVLFISLDIWMMDCHLRAKNDAPGDDANSIKIQFARYLIKVNFWMARSTQPLVNSPFWPRPLYPARSSSEMFGVTWVERARLNVEEWGKWTEKWGFPLCGETSDPQLVCIQHFSLSGRFSWSVRLDLFQKGWMDEIMTKKVNPPSPSWLNRGQKSGRSSS